MSDYNELVSQLCERAGLDAVTCTKVLKSLADIADEAGPMKAMQMLGRLMELAKERNDG